MFIKGYSDFSLTKTGVKSNYEPIANWGARFKLDNDVSQLFPYINAAIQGSRFYDKPEHIQFYLDCFKCTVYPTEVIAVPFTDQNQALEFVRYFIDFLNDLYNKKDLLKPDHKKYTPVSVLDIFKLLPGTNCRECGFFTCMAFAAALSKNETATNRCPYFCEPISENAIYPVYDKNGNLASTVTIEINSAKTDQENLEQDNKNPQTNNKNRVQTDLTDREIEVLRLVAKGATNTKISEKLSISPHTVKSHIIHILNKLGVNSRTQAAVWAAQKKIL